MTNMTKVKFKALQIKAAEISAHFETNRPVYVRSGQEILRRTVRITMTHSSHRVLRMTTGGSSSGI